MLDISILPLSVYNTTGFDIALLWSSEVHKRPHNTASMSPSHCACTCRTYSRYPHNAQYKYDLEDCHTANWVFKPIGYLLPPQELSKNAQTLLPDKQELFSAHIMRTFTYIGIEHAIITQSQNSLAAEVIT